MAVIINTVDANYFELNGERYATIYQPLVTNVSEVAIYNVYDTKLQLLGATDFTEFTVDGNTFISRDLLIDALLPVIYKNVSGGGGTASWGSITGTLSAQTDLQSALDGKAPLVHTHVTSDITNLGTYTGFDVRYYTKSQADSRYIQDAPVDGLEYVRKNGSWVNGVSQIQALQSVTTQGAVTTDSITTAGYIVSGGLSSQFLKADGSLDSTDYTEEAPSDGKIYGRQNGSWVDAQEGTVLLSWSFDTTTTAGASAGDIRFNNATPASVTEIYVSDTGNSGADISTILASLANAKFYIQGKKDSGDYLAGQITAVADNTTYYTLTVNVQDSGTLPSNNDIVGAIFFGTGGGGGGGGTDWGEIGGVLSAQTDLQSALDAKVDLAGDTMTGDLTITGVTQSNLTVSDGFIGASNGHAYKALMGTSSTTNNYLFGGSSTGSANTFDTYVRVRSVADGDLTFQEAGNAHKVWHAGNIDPVDRTGDTMTGRLTVTGNGVPVLTEGTGAIGDLSAQNYYVARDSAGVNLWYLGMPSASNNDLTLYNYDSARALTIKDGAGELTYNGSTVDFSSAVVDVNDIRIDDISIWYVSSADTAHQRADARDDATNFARLHWYGVSDAGSTSNFRHAWYDGSAYIDVTATSGGITWDSGSSGVASYVVTGGVSGTSLTVGTAGSSEGELNIVKGDTGSMGISYEDNYFRYRRGGGGTIAGWRWDNFDTTVATLATDGALTTNGYRMNASAGYYQSHPTSSRDKFRVWNSALYTIGFQASLQYGSLNTDYAMTFQVNSDNDRGFWWGDDQHTTGQGAMSLTTNGKLTVATGIRVGYGESDTTILGTTYDIQVSGDIQASDFALASDERLKNIISHHAGDCYVYEYKYGKQKGRKRYGVIAQRIEERYPHAVKTNEAGIKDVSYFDYLTAKVGELEERIKKLENGFT